ncbi:unnamed protein product [Closterium sp. NIES-53]
MYLMTCTRPDLAYPLSLLVRYVDPGRHRKVHWDAAKRVLRYLCSTSGMGLVLGGRGPVDLTGHVDASWAPSLSAPAATATGAAATAAPTTTAAPAYYAAMASLRVLGFDHEGRPVQFDTWLDDLQLTAQALYDSVVARYSSPATAALGRLLLPYLFPELSAFATVEDLVSHLRASDARNRTAAPTEDHFLSLNPTSLTVDLLEQHLLSAETSAVAVGAACGTPRPPFFEGCSPLPPPTPLLLLQTSLLLRTSGLLLLVQSAAAARARVAGVVEVAAGVVVGAAVEVVAAVGLVEGVGVLVAAVEAAVGVAAVAAVGLVAVGLALGVLVLEVASVNSSSVGARPSRPSSFTCGKLHTQHRCFSRLDDAWRAEFGDDVELPRWADLLRSRIAIFDLDFDVILSAMYALSVSAEGDCYRCVPPDPGIGAAALGASESGTLPGTVPAQALHTFTLESGASRCFFCDCTTLTPLPAPVPVNLVDPSRGPVVARSSTVLPCPAVLFGSLSGFHLPSFSTNLVSTPALQDAMVTTTNPEGQRVSICTCTWTGRHLATSGSRLLLVSPPDALDTSVAPPLGSPLLATPSWHALPCSRLWSTQVSASPPALACPALPSVRRGAAARCSSLLLVSPDDCSIAHSPHGRDLPVLRLHSDRGDEFSSNLLRDFCRGEGILQSFTFPDSPQQNGIAERRIGLVMEVARTSMIYAAAPHFLWPFAVWYAAHQLNLWPCVSLPETSPTLRWTGEVGDESVFRVWGSRAFVRDTSTDKLSARAILCVFLGFVPDALGWLFYQPTLRRVLPSHDVTFNESVPFYRLFPYRSAPPPRLPLFLAPGPPPIDPLPPQGPPPSDVSQVDPLPGTAPVEVAVGSGAARGAASGGAASGGAEPGGARSEGAGSGGAGSEGEEPGGVEPEGAEPRRAASTGGPAGALPRLSPQQLREWLSRRARLWSGAPGAGGAGDARAGGAGVTTGAGGTGDTTAAGPGGARTRGAGAAGSGGVGGDVAVGARDSCAGGAGVGGARAGGARVGGTGAGGTGAVGAGAVLVVPSSTGLIPPLLCPPPDQSQPLLQPTSPLLAPSPYTELSGGLTERREPPSHPVSPFCTTRCAPRLHPPPVPGMHAMALHPSTVPLRVPLPHPPESSLPEVPDLESDRARAASPIVSRRLATAVTDPSFESAAASALVAELLDFAAVCRLDYANSLVAESASASPPSIGGECALGTDVLEDRQEDFESLAVVVPRFASMLIAPEGDPDAPDIPTPRSYAEAITGPYPSEWQAAMDAEMASWKSTGTYVDEVPPPGANIVNGMWIFRGVDNLHTFSPTPKMTSLRVLLHVSAQSDYELHSLDFCTAFLQGSLHEEIWLRRPLGFTRSFPVGTRWSLRQPVYSLRQAPREWHDTLRTTLAALGFAPSTADPSLFLLTDTSLPPFYVLVYVDDHVFATGDTEALTLVKSELQKRHTCTDLGPSALRLPVLLATAHSSVYRPLALSSTFGRVRSAESSVPRDCGLPHASKGALGCCEEGTALPVEYVGHGARAWRTGSSCPHRSRRRF